MKHKNNGFFLLDTDIEKLHARYHELYKQVENYATLSEEYQKRERDNILASYDFQIQMLNKLRAVEYETLKAKIKARAREQIPWRRCWLWRLLGLPLTNRAQDVIEDEAAIDAEEIFSALEKGLNERSDKFEGDFKPLTRRERRKLLKAYKKALRSGNVIEPGETLAQPEPGTDPGAFTDDVQSEPEPEPINDVAEPPPPPMRKARVKETAITS